MIYLNKTPYFLSLLSGFLLWLSFPSGGGVTPVLAVALVPLLFALSKVDFKRSLICGLLAGLVHYFALIYWIVIVVGKYGGLPLPLSVLALVLLTLYMCIYTVLFACIANRFVFGLSGLLSLLLIPTLWVGLDWFRGIFLTGFPWMDLGYALFNFPSFIQIADLIGHHGVSFLIVLVNVFIFHVITMTTSRGSKLLSFLITLSLIAAAGYYSVNRNQEIGRLVASESAVTARIGVVQGNMDQSQKWSLEKQHETVDKYVSITEKLTKGDKTQLVVWPETALPFYPPANEYMTPLRQLVKRSNIGLLTGAPWYEIIDREAKTVKFYNSGFLLAATGGIEDKYFKQHLVPFGEYVPLKKYLPFLNPLVEAVGDFSPGKTARPLQWKDARLGLLICFESVFPELSRQWVLQGANILVNLTNDAWYGRSSAPHQSLAMAVFRAVETRRSLVRSANTGISAFVSPTGEVVAQSPLFVNWAKSEDVPLLETTTFWVKYGYLFGPLCLLVTLAGVAFVSLKKAGHSKLK